MNVVPDKCSIGIDFRTLPGQEHQAIIADIEEICSRLKVDNEQFEASISVLREVQSMETDCSSDFIRDFCSVVGTDKTMAVGYTTDGPYFASIGSPVVIFGPGKPHLCHKPDEYIDITDIEKGVEYYKNIIRKFLT